MFAIKTVELIVWVVSVAIAYVISATTAGYFQAWAAWHLGDDSPELEEFVTWNPFVHVDPFGALCLFALGIGWGKFVPIVPERIRGTFRLLLLFLAKPFAYIVIAFAALLVLLRVFGLNVLNVAMMMVLSESVSLGMLTHVYPEHSSFTLAIAMTLVVLIYVGVLFAVLNFIIDGFRFALHTFLHQFAHSPEGDLMSFVIPLLTMVFFAHYLKELVVYGISHSAYYIAPLIGVV